MARSKTDGDRAVAERIAKGKDPEKALKRAFPDRDIGEVLWTWLADGLLPLTGKIGDLAGQNTRGVPVPVIVRAAGQLTRHPLRSAPMTWSVMQSYEAGAEPWDSAWDTLPHDVQLLLLWPLQRARKPIPDALRDEAALIFARAAVDDDHDHISHLLSMARGIGVDDATFTRLVVETLEATPVDAIRGRGHIMDALEAAPWPLARRVLATWPDARLIREVLEHRKDSYRDLQSFLRERGLETDPDYANMLAQRTDAQGETVPESLDDALVQRFVGGNGDARAMAMIAQFPPARFEAFAAAVRGAGATELCCLGLLRDPARDAEAEALVVRIIEEGIEADDYRHVLSALSTPLRGIAAAGSHGYAILERVLSKARSLDARFGDKLAFAVYPPLLRFQLRRAMFLATAGIEPRPLDLFLPGEDLLWVGSLVDVFGPHGGGWEILSDVAEEERRRALVPWARLNWDGTLKTYDAESDAQAPPPIEEMSWVDLAAAIEKTGYPRLSSGEKERSTVSRAMQRAPNDAERVALVDRVLARVTAWPSPVLRGLMPLVTAVLPAWIAEARPVEGARETVGYALLSAGAMGDLRDLLLRLPSAQVDGWIARMGRDPDRRVKKNAKALAELRKA